MRLDKYISSQMNITRSETKKLISQGRVRVNGSVAKADLQIDENKDRVEVSGKAVGYRKNVYIMLNKPAGVICATRDRISQTVLDLIPEDMRRRSLFPAGRLDKDTRGFVLITDDGAFGHEILSPKHHVEKEYEVWLRDPIKNALCDIFAAGIVIDGEEKCEPAVLITTDDPKFVRLIIHEGKYHQIKRMFEAVGNLVVGLRRIRIGGLFLDASLAEGQCKALTDDEIVMIQKKE